MEHEFHYLQICIQAYNIATTEEAREAARALAKMHIDLLFNSAISLDQAKKLIDKAVRLDLDEEFVNGLRARFIGNA